MNVKLIDQTVLPKTYAAIQEEFADKSLRAAVWESAKHGSVRGLAHRIALTANGLASLGAVAEVLEAEWSEAGLNKVYVGEADPSVYGEGQVAAYLDQPL
jgi:hypothetical protein